MQYTAEIDRLRSLAVLQVILFYACFDWFNGGFVGVDVLYVINGYLITTIIISEIAEGNSAPSIFMNVMLDEFSPLYFL